MTSLPSTARARMTVSTRLRDRKAEIEEAVLARVYAVDEPSAQADSEYAHGLRNTISAALDYGLCAVERGEGRAPPVPPGLLSQARLAARDGVSLDTVLRRYVAGYTLLGDYLIQEAEKGGLLSGAALQQLSRGLAVLFERVIAAVSEEYSREEGGRFESAKQRRADRVRRLLAGEALDTSELAYEFGNHHLGAIAVGPDAEEVLCEVLEPLGGRLLLVRHEEATVWGWCGLGRPPDLDRVPTPAGRPTVSRASVALGEPAEGLAGWRLTHRQARAAMPVALRAAEGLVRYSDVALLASMLRDDLLVASLRDLYLAPLEQERDGGTAARETLRAYFAAEHNVTSAAAALGVNRHTITNRLRSIEQRIGRSLGECATEVDAALRLDELSHQH